MSRDMRATMAAMGWHAAAHHGSIDLTGGADPVEVLADLESAVRRSIVAERAAGWIYVSVLHGDVETPDDLARLQAIRDLVATFTDDDGQPTCAAYRGGSDWSTWCLRGPRAGLAQAAILGRITEVAASWWRYSTDGTPPRGLSEGIAP